MASDDYHCSGTVENVAYNYNTNWPCFVALSGSCNSNFYTSQNVAQCEFAERAKLLGKPLHMYGDYERKRLWVITWDGTGGIFSNPREMNND